jgi:hypothetical protein
MNLNGFPLNFKAAYLIVSKYLALYYGVESNLCGKKEIIQRPK